VNVNTSPNVPATALGPLVTQSLQEAVYARLRAMIRSGELQERTNDRGLRLLELAGYLGVSTMPIREAVRRLEAEGLVTFSRNGGIHVVRLSRNSFSEIAEMRVRLETLVMDRALPLIRDPDLDRAAEFLAQMDRPLPPGDWREANLAFHRALYAPADYPRVVATVENLWTAVEPYMRIYTGHASHLTGAQEDHRALLAAVRGHEPRKALSIVEAHIRRSATLLLSDPDGAWLLG
jgi:DNA-binding GntR family transcriptional regulator